MAVDRGPISRALPQSLNRYIYAMADPVNYTDPSGLSREIPLPPPTLPIYWAQRPNNSTLLGEELEVTQQRRKYRECDSKVLSDGLGVLRPRTNPLPGSRINRDDGRGTADGRFSLGGLHRRYLDLSPKPHVGLDLGADIGTNILATAAGTVTVTSAEGYGTFVIIDHGSNFLTRYAHVGEVRVTHGARVKAGDPIAGVGMTDVPANAQPHLHFEVVYAINFKVVCHLDPGAFFDFQQ